MAASIIPLRNDYPAYSLRVDLSGEEFLISMRFNARDACWYMSLADSTASKIVDSVKVVIDLPLLRKVVDERRPAGDLYAIDNEDSDVEAQTVADLGDDGARVILVYDDGQD